MKTLEEYLYGQEVLIKSVSKNTFKDIVYKINKNYPYQKINDQARNLKVLVLTKQDGR